MLNELVTRLCGPAFVHLGMQELGTSQWLKLAIDSDRLRPWLLVQYLVNLQIFNSLYASC